MSSSNPFASSEGEIACLDDWRVRRMDLDQPGLAMPKPGQVVLTGLLTTGCPNKVKFTVNGEDWATLPTTSRTEHSSGWTVSCTIAPLAAANRVQVECFDADNGARLCAQSFDATAPVNSYGLQAKDVYDVNSNALFSCPWIFFDGAILTISGAHLPPHGDPDLLSVEFAPGVAGTFNYPLSSPDFGAHYWYWPNAAFSGFQVRIDLPASRAASHAFSFRFVTRHRHHNALGGTPWLDRSRIWIPASLRAFLDHPKEGNQLSRVQTWSNHQSVTVTGFNAFKLIASLAARHGVHPFYGMKVLDWGCGHGRVARHMMTEWPEAHLTGLDIDPENIAWCRDNLTDGVFDVAPLWPPCTLPDASFDLIFGLSVMTHLTAQAQHAWLAELHRLLKPGGLALISFGGAAAAAYASVHHTPEWWQNWQMTGFDDSLEDTALEQLQLERGYYRVTHQTEQNVRDTWSFCMTIVDVEHQAIGYQDIAVMRPHPAVATRTGPQ